MCKQSSFLLDPVRLYTYFKEYAGVAELVDALDSGSSVRKDVRVRVSPSAPRININQFCNNFTFGNKWACVWHKTDLYFVFNLSTTYHEIF